MNCHPSRYAVLCRLHPKSHGEQIVDKHDLVSAYCIRDLNQDHGLFAHSPQSPKISSADHRLTRQTRDSTTRMSASRQIACWFDLGFTAWGGGFPNRRRAERLLSIKSECDRLMHSEGLFIRVTNSRPAWQGRRSTASGLWLWMLTRCSHGIRLARALRINGPSATKCFGPIASISVQLQHSTIHIAL